MNLPNFQSIDETLAYLDDIELKIKTAKNEILSAGQNDNFETLENCFKRLDMTPELKFIPTKLQWLDNEMGHGIAEGSFINLAGASFSGKTFLALELLQSIGENERVVFFSYEMYEKVLYRKLRFSTTNFRKNLILIQDTPYLDKIEARIRKFADEGIRLIVIDSRMKIQLREKTDEYIKNLTISATLSRVCRESGVIVILINQMNESDLKNSRFSLKGGNEQVYDSDMIFYVIYDKDKDERWLICDKDRLSDTGRKWRCKIPNFFSIKQPCAEYEFRE